MIKYLPQASEIIAGPASKNICLFEVPPITVKEVIFGSKISAGDKELVEQAIRARAPHILKKQIEFIPGSGLQVMDL